MYVYMDIQILFDNEKLARRGSNEKKKKKLKINEKMQIEN